MERMRYAPSPMLATAKPNMKMHLFTLNHDESVCTSALCKLAIDCVIATHCSSQSSSLDAESLYLAFGWVGVERVLFRDGNSMSSGSSASSCRREGRKSFALIAMSNSRSRGGQQEEGAMRTNEIQNNKTQQSVLRNALLREAKNGVFVRTTNTTDTTSKSQTSGDPHSLTISTRSPHLSIQRPLGHSTSCRSAARSSSVSTFCR